MITDGLGYKNRMVEEEFGISAVATVLLKSIRMLFKGFRKESIFDSPARRLIFASKEATIR